MTRLPTNFTVSLNSMVSLPSALIIFGGGIAILAFAVAIALLFEWFRSARLTTLSYVLLSISVPRVLGADAERVIHDITLSEQLFSALSSIGKPVVFEVSVHAIGEEIHFYLSVPRESESFASDQIRGLYPGAQVERVKDYTVFNPHGVAVAGYLTLKESFPLPIRSYREASLDTFAPIVSSLSHLEAIGDGASLQFIFQPEEPLVKKRLLDTINQVKKGVSLSDAIKGVGFGLKDIHAEFTAAPKRKEEREEERSPIDTEAVATLERKAASPLLSVLVRIITSSENEDRALDLFNAIAGSFSQFATPKRNGFIAVRPRDAQSLLYRYSFREWSSRESITLNAEELASIFHIPTGALDVPRVSWLHTREIAPPSALPDDGVAIGESIFRGDRRTVRLLAPDRLRHIYTVGQTGTGKSSLLFTMATQDIERGNGLCVIDPHGDLVNDLLSVVPQSRINDVIVFDPGDLTRPLGLNMLEHSHSRPEEKSFIVAELQSIFNRLFTAETMGPMFEQYMRNALLLLMEDMEAEPATLIEVPRVFTDPEFRKRKLSRIKNPVVIDFWEKEAVKTSGEQGLANMTPYITSKFNNFIANDYIRPIIGQPRSSFNFREVMDTKKILLVNLSKGKIGDLNAGLIGMIVTGRILLSALSRADQASEDRTDFYLYIDEFQNFTTDSIAVILSEARKYRLALTIAHQFISQLTESIKGAVFGNVGTLAIFRVGADDAKYLEGQVSPNFSTQDLVSIENRNAVLKMLLRGEPVPAFNIRTIDAKRGSREVAEKLKELSRLSYGRELAQVEADILSRLRM